MTRPSIYKKAYLIVLLSLITAFFCLWLRTAPPYYPGKYFLAEDGFIFTQQAWTAGISSLWIPHAGYLHLYIRLTALFCRLFELNLIEISYVFLFGWLIAFLSMIAVIVVRAQSFKLPPLYIYWLVVLIAFQPQPEFGEVFFHLTNSQWPLGAALGIYLLTRNKNKASIFELLFIIILGLSGPFSLFVTPLFFLKEWIEKNLKNTCPLLITLFLCALVQGVLIACSVRGGPLKSHHDVPTAIILMGNTLFFNVWGLFGIKKIFFLILAAFFFWILVFNSFKTAFLSKNTLHSKVSPALLFFFAFICLLSAIFEGFSSPKALSERYFFIPYTVFFFSAAILSSHSKKALLYIFLSMSCICLINFNKIMLAKAFAPNPQFKSYAHFAEYHRILVPIHPKSYDFNCTFEFGKAALPGLLSKFSALQTPNLYSFSSNEIKTNISNQMIIAQIKNNTSTLFFSDPLYCPKGSDIGVEIALRRNKKGFLTLWWSDNKNFTSEQSITYIGRKGNIRADFAFPNTQKKIYLAFSPNDRIDTVEIKSLNIYCLPEEKNS